MKELLYYQIYVLTFSLAFIKQEIPLIMSLCPSRYRILNFLNSIWPESGHSFFGLVSSMVQGALHRKLENNREINEKIIDNNYQNLFTKVIKMHESKKQSWKWKTVDANWFLMCIDEIFLFFNILGVGKGFQPQHLKRNLSQYTVENRFFLLIKNLETFAY